MERSMSPCCKSYRLVLMDINMPVMDGVQAAKIIKDKVLRGEIPPTITAALSAEPFKEEEKTSLYAETGFSSYVMKPTTKDEFTHLLRQYDIII